MKPSEKRPIPDFPEYQADTDGNIWSCKLKAGARWILSHPNKLLKPAITKFGYLMVNLRKNNKNYSKLVHQLVANTFIPKTNREINHKDGNKKNNNSENLEWITRSNNVKHAFLLGLASNRGERNSRATITEDDVIKIRNLYYVEKIPMAKLTKKYKLPRSTMHHIISGYTWKHLPIPILDETSSNNKSNGTT